MERKEFRRDRRYLVPAVSLTIRDSEYRARNWSLGGLLLERAAPYSVGARIAGELRVDGHRDGFVVRAEVLRRDPAEGTLACRFVDPPPSLIDGLDNALAHRLMRRRASSRGTVARAVLVFLMLAAAAPAVAATESSVANPDQAATLVPGGFRLPEFHLSFPELLSGPPPAGPGDLQISLTSGGKNVLQFLFSPRSEFAFASDPTTGASRSYAGLSWNLFDKSGFFGNLDLSGSLTQFGPDPFYRQDYGPPLALHSTFELGFKLGASHSLTLSLDHSQAPDLFGDHYDINNLRLRYGLKF